MKTLMLLVTLCLIAVTVVVSEAVPVSLGSAVSRLQPIHRAHVIDNIVPAEARLRNNLSGERVSFTVAGFTVDCKDPSKTAPLPDACYVLYNYKTTLAGRDSGDAVRLFRGTLNGGAFESGVNRRVTALVKDASVHAAKETGLENVGLGVFEPVLGYHQQTGAPRAAASKAYIREKFALSLLPVVVSVETVTDVRASGSSASPQSVEEALHIAKQ
mmetsp:Transcript_7215/g.19328  ORF Transcript_7215/g.19328 Transcript_7215/m.19328 type:complete len:215 (+) Transcript_7215:80-724(+)